MLSRANIVRWIDGLLHLHDTPHRVAVALALGTGLSFSPLLGLQILVGIAVAFIFNLNRVAVFAGLCANVPWIMIPYYAGVTALAAAVLGIEVPADMGATLSGVFVHSPFSGAFWTTLASVMRPWFVPFVVGSGIASAMIAGITYPAALLAIKARRRREAHRA